MYRMIFTLIVLTGMLVLPHYIDVFNLKDKELLLYFSFDDDKGNTVKDLSTHKNDGEIVGAADFVEGKAGQAIKFTAV